MGLFVKDSNGLIRETEDENETVIEWTPGDPETEECRNDDRGRDRFRYGRRLLA